MTPPSERGGPRARTSVAGALSLLAVTTLHAYEWEIEAVDNLGVVGYTSIAVDGSGCPHISYAGGGDPRYAYKDTSGWHVETVEPGPGIGWHTSVALDGNGCPCISYYDGINDAVKYARKPGSLWQIELVDTCLDWGGYTSLALDAADGAHMSYVYMGPDIPAGPELRYARRTLVGWQIEVVCLADVGAWTSLALDGAGWPHISYYFDCFYPGDVVYCYKDEQGWHTVVPWQGNGHTSLALDALDYPHISLDYLGLWYTYNDASGGDTEMVDGPEGTAPQSSIAIDGAGHAHIAYHQTSTGDLRYAYRAGSGWHIHTVDSLNAATVHVSLTLDSADRAHIGYASGGVLKYARGEPMCLSAGLDNGTLVLTWTAFPGASAYWIYGACNDAYFSPGFAPAYEHRLAMLPYTTVTWSTSTGVSDPDSNWTYLVLPVDAAEQELCRSNRAGEQDFPAGVE